MAVSLASLRGASRDALAAARERLETVLASEPGGPAGAAALADDLASLADLLYGQVSLRRLFTDPSRPAEARADMATSLLSGKIGDLAIETFAGLVRSRWSQPRDIATAVEVLAVDVDLTAAERAGTLDGVEDDLFRFGRIIASEPQLAAALTHRTPAEARAALVDGLVRGKVDPISARLIIRAVRAPHGRAVTEVLSEYADFAAARRERLVAMVRTVVPLTAAQRERLQAVLRRLYGRDVHLNIELDADLIGGITVQIGDQVIDGSLASKISTASRQIAG